MGYRIKSKLWIEIDGHILLGEGRIQLLKAIDETGSLSSAARNTGISYKKAWKLMDTVNQNARETVVITSRGGSGGGGAELTPYGRELIQKFEQIKKECWDLLKESEKKLSTL